MAENCKISRWAQLKQTLQNLSPKVFAQYIENHPEAILLDCRTPEEYEFGRLENAVNFNYLSKDLVGEMDRLDPQAMYLVYCRSERRSIRTCVLLKNGGFGKVYNLDGGLKNWVKTFGEDSLERPGGKPVSNKN